LHHAKLYNQTVFYHIIGVATLGHELDGRRKTR
jgi:hypothetical protein